MTRQRGFTLTDILVTIFLIAALVSLALPILGRMHRSAQASRKKADLNTITVALEAFKARHGDYPRLNEKTLRLILPHNSNEEFISKYNALLDSQTRGAQLLTAALVGGGFIDSSFRTVEVYDEALGQNVRLLATHDDRPILYYPGLPVRLDLSQQGGYVAAMGPAEIEARRQASGTWQLPLFNAWDNAQFLPEAIVQAQLKANPDGSARNTVPEYCGAYLLWAAGDEPDLRQAYQSSSAILMVGGGQPLIMVPGGTYRGNGLEDYTRYVSFDPSLLGNNPRGMEDSPYVRPDLTVGNPLELIIKPPVEWDNQPPPGWVEHEIPPRTPGTPPADAIKITDKGAKPNDGVDDWQAIKDALDQARREGKAIVIPDGQFDISKPLPIESGTKIYGPGALKLHNGHDFAMIIPAGANGIYIDGIALEGGGIRAEGKASNVTFINNVVANISHKGSYNNGAGFVANSGLVNSRIEQNHFINIRQEGVWINTNASGTSVSYNYFEDVWQAIHVISKGDASGIRMNHNYGVGLIRMGIEFQGDGAIGSEIIGNTFKDWNQAEVYHGSFGLSIYNMGSGTKILDNMLHGYGNNPVGIEMGGHNGLAQGNVVTGFREGMHVIHADNSVITGNTFTGQKWMSIWFPGYGSAYNVKVVNNSFDVDAEAAILFMGGGWGGTVIEGNTARLHGNTQFVKSHSGTNGLHIGSNTIIK